MWFRKKKVIENKPQLSEDNSLSSQFQTVQDPSLPTMNVIIWKNNDKYCYPGGWPGWETKDKWMVEAHSSPCHAGMISTDTFEQAFNYAIEITKGNQARILIRKPIESDLIDAKS